MVEALPVDWNIGLRKERERRGWTRAELAEKIRVGVHSIYRWEEKGHKINEDAVKTLTRLFGKPVDAWGKTMWKMPYLPNAYFTGREQVLKYLNERLGVRAIRDPGRLPVAISQSRAISGLGGIGKTQTAVEYAYRFKDDYDMVVLVHASEREVLVGELASLAPLLGLPTYNETNQERLAVAVKRWLETQKEQVWLLIFDNVDDFEVVRKFLPEKGDGAVLLTTRLQAVGTHIRKVSLNTLSLEEGMMFFQERLGEGEDPGRRTLSEPERRDAAELAALLGGLPLALEQAAAYIEEYRCSLAEYVRLYQEQRATLLQMQKLDPNDYRASVATTWLISFQRVEEANPDAVLLLRLLAFLHPDAIPENALLQGAAELGPAFQTAAENAPRLQAAIELLQRYSLIRYHQPTKTLTIHRLVQAVIQDGLGDALARQWAERAVRLVNRSFPGGEFSTWDRCGELMPQVLACVDHIKTWGLALREAGDLLFRAGENLALRNQFEDALALMQQSLAIRQQVLDETHPDVANSLNDMGYISYEMGRYEDAFRFYQQALEIRQQVLDETHPDITESLNNLAEAYRMQGKYADALPLYQRALALRERTLGPNDPNIADYLNNLALLYQAQEDYEQAGQCFQRALTILEQTLEPTNPRVAVGLNNLSGVLRAQGAYEEALKCIQRAQAISEQALGPENPYMAQCLYNLAELSQAQGKYEQAVRFFEQALTMLEQGLGPDHPSVATRLNSLANLHQAHGEYEQALPLYERALAIQKRALGVQHPDLAETVHDLARLREAQGTLSEAKTLYEEALHQREQAFGIDHPKTVETRRCLVALLSTMGRHEEAARMGGPDQGSGKEGRDTAPYMQESV